MRSFTRRVRIDAPRDRVWAFATDLANAAAWIQGVERTEPITPGPQRMGSRFRETRTLGGRTETLEVEVTAFDAPHHYEGTARVPNAEFRYTYTLTEAEEGRATDVKLVAEARATSLLGRLFLPMGFAMMKQFDGDQLERLKAAVEQPPAGARGRDRPS